MPTKPADPIVTRLRALAESSPDLKNAAQIYEIVLPLVRDADLRVQPMALTEEQSRQKLESRVPILQDEELVFDIAAARDLMLQLARALEKKNKAASKIRNAVEQSKLDVKTILSQAFRGESNVVAARAEESQLDSALLWTLAQNTLKPALRAWAKQFASLGANAHWNKGYCFVCGATAALSELQGNDQARHLRCGQCGADWEFRRFECMYCGNDSHKTLSYLYADTQREKMYLQVCENCKGYSKFIAAFSPESAEMLPIEDLESLHLDFIAQQQGYERRQVDK